MRQTGLMIRQHRKDLNMKIIELAQKIGINPVYITQIEKHNKLPSIKIYLEIEKYLNLPIIVRKSYFNEKYPELSKLLDFPVEIEKAVEFPQQSKESPVKVLQKSLWRLD